MRVSDIVRMAVEYGTFAMTIVLLSVGLFLLGYFVIYKWVFKGQRRISKQILAMSVILGCYLIVVLGVTLGRIDIYQGSLISLRPFRAYREAWNTFSIVEWRNIILNICMFVPLGFLLPLFLNIFKTCYWTYLTGFLLSLSIEVIQLTTGRGVFEIDDLMGNTVGSMIGYGLIRIVLYLIDRWQMKDCCKVKVVLAYQTPLILVGVLFGTIFYTYHYQELGNLSIASIYPVSMKEVDLQSTVQLSTEVASASVYESKIITQSESLDLANEWLSYVEKSVDESQSIFYDQLAVYYSEDGNYHLWIDYVGPTVDLTDFSQFDSKGQSNYTYEEVRNILAQYGLELPEEGLQFIDEGDGNYRLIAEMVEFNDKYLDGELRCTLTENQLAYDINYSMIEYEPYKEYEILSEQQAFEQLEKGNWNPGFGYRDGFINKIEVNNIKLNYSLDTKGYYQPIYEFVTMINGEQNTIQIPAIP